MAAASAFAHVGLKPPAPPPVAAPSAERPPRWSAAVYCQTHQRFLGGFQDAGLAQSPAAETLCSGVYGLLLFGPEARFTVRLLYRGVLSEGGQTLEGDLCLRGVHPALLQAEELWRAVQAVRRRGLRKIRGRVLWESDLVPGQHHLLEELRTRLDLAGVSFEPPAPGPLVSVQETELWSYESRPLALVLRREPGLLRSILPEPAALRRTLRDLDRLKTDWVPEGFPKLGAEDVVTLLRKVLEHDQVGSVLGAAFRPLPACIRLKSLRGIVARAPQLTELLGRAELPGHGPVLFELRIAAEVPEAELGSFLDRALRETLGEAGQFLVRQELLGPRLSSEHHLHSREGTDGRRPQLL